MYPGEIFIKVSSIVGSSINMKNLLMVLTFDHNKLTFNKLLFFLHKEAIFLSSLWGGDIY